MKKILATIGEGQFSKRQIRSLESFIRQNYRTFINAEPVLVVWNRVPVQNIFHDYQNGQPSILVIEAHQDTQQQQRVAMFEACTRDWLRLTGQRIDQLIISIPDSPVFSALLRRSSAHLTAWGKVVYYFKLVSDLLFTKSRDGFYSFKSSF